MTWLKRLLPWLFVVTLAWDPSPSTDVLGYKLYIWDGCTLPMTDTNRQKNLWKIKDVGKLLKSSLVLPKGHYCFAVTAYDRAGYESAYSNFIDSSVIGNVPSKIHGFRRR